MPAHPIRFRLATLRATPLLAVLAAGIAVSSPAVPAPSASTKPATTTTTAAALPANSVYQLPVALTDQTGREFRLADQRGKPMLVSMFYSNCQFVCPMLIDTLRDTEAKLSPGERDHLGVLMVSIDPAHDTVAVLKQKADERGVAAPRWAMARTDAASVRKLAAVLGIQYRALANGEFNHTTALILLDADGRIVGRSSQLGNADPAFVAKVRQALQAASH
ncbi:MAG TPA: SCO family protein [Caldimonas sp.]|nr:SCO family protein [Caldimonas sp.]